ncbi:hypothetical protein P4607_23670 [Priestia megaterium]|uniref:hypothetical protein n=1 Tax=Priestia megaterium TaxID=1404 RepID=UPI002E1D7F6E|nr:hypothetical protein [Priestia megaterium]
MYLNYIGMLAGLIIALANIFNSEFEGFMRWVIVSGGLLAFMCHLKIILDKKRNRVVNQNEKKT